MHPPHQRPPGPIGKSCLTCKHRHTKCDRRKPFCERCSRAGYECLGYKNNRSSTHYRPEALNEVIVSKGIISSSRPPRDSAWSSFAHESHPKDVATDPCANGTDDVTEAVVEPNLACTPRADLSGVFAGYESDALIHDTFPPSRFKTPTTDTGPELPLAATDRLPLQPILFSRLLLCALGSPSPNSTTSPSDIGSIARYVKWQCDRLLGLVYFKPRREQIDAFQAILMWRFSTCGFARTCMLIDAKITDSIIEGNDTLFRPDFILWIEEFEKEVNTRLAQPLTSYELQERCADLIEIFLLKSALLDASTIYSLFCRTAPRFLQMIYCDSALRPVGDFPALVSIAHLIASPRYGPACFALMDIMGSMVYGVRQLVNYNIGVEPFHHEPHLVERINCFPGEFQILLARINSYRDQGAAVGDWQDVERRLISWTSRPKFEPKGLESWKLIAWTAVQETWRHTLLIYLYLAVCGAPTDDPRIQSSRRQLFPLLGTIRRQDPPISNVHLFAQCLIAGTCSHNEKQRQLVRERLGNVAETRFCMFRGSEIVPVLDHLWQGVAHGGRAVTWNDYIHSRRTVLPLSA